jgi:hypothetical protein
MINSCGDSGIIVNEDVCNINIGDAEKWAAYHCITKEQRKGDIGKLVAWQLLVKIRQQAELIGNIRQLLEVQYYNGQTTKVCPNCYGTRLLEFTTFNYKRCGDCGTQVAWVLDKGQKPLL